MQNIDIKILQKKQKEYFQSGITKDYSFRIDNLNKLCKMIKDNETKIFKALKDDLNKSETESFTSEFNYILKEIQLVKKNLKKWMKPQRVKTPFFNKPGKAFLFNEPYGSVVIIGPWNYPFGLTFTPIVGAIAAGNCVIAKPSEIASNSSKLIYQMVSETFQEDFFAVVEGGPEIASELINKDTDYIFFTGSTSVGKIIMKKASDYLIPLTLELSGKNPCIVDSDVDLDVAAKRIVWGKFFNAGQTCISPDYLLVHKKIETQFLEKLIETVHEFYLSDSSSTSDFTTIIDKKHFERLSNLLTEGNCIIGGNTEPERLFIAPTILSEINFDSEIMKDEIFGPILPVISYSNLEDEIKRINSQEKSLSIYLFSNNELHKRKIINETSSGTVCINGTIHTFISQELPFGGVGASGFGKYHGEYSFLTFCHQKSVLKKSFRFDIEQVYPPYKMEINKLKKVFALFN